MFPRLHRTLSDDLEPDWEVTALAPGRFSNRIQKHATRTHAFQLIREQTTSSFVLTLAVDGSATLARGYRYSLFNDGPEVHTEDHVREQLGYRGQWKHGDGSVMIDLEIDDGVCPRVAHASSGAAAERARAWQLRCVPLIARRREALTAPILACQTGHAEPVLGEDAPHVVAGVLGPGAWIVLGAGNGLAIRERPAMAGEPAVRVELSSEIVEISAWEHPF